MPVHATEYSALPLCVGVLGIQCVSEWGFDTISAAIEAGIEMSVKDCVANLGRCVNAVVINVSFLMWL